MKIYARIQEIMAEEMSKDEAFEKSLLEREDIPTEEDEQQKGYFIYTDGRKSWLPAEVFEKSYTLVNTPIDRLLFDKKELDKRLNKLREFIEGDEFHEVNDGIRLYSYIQFTSMDWYSKILYRRICELRKYEERKNTAKIKI